MQDYPKMLYHRRTLQPVVVHTAAEDWRLTHDGGYINSPAEVGIETAPSQDRVAVARLTMTRAQADAVRGARPVPTLRQKDKRMYQALWTGSLGEASVEELIFLEAVAKLICAGMLARQLDPPASLLRRQSQIERQLLLRLEEDLQVAEYELEQLAPVEEKRATKAKRVRKLRDIVGYPALDAPKRE